MILNYLKITIRNLYKEKLYAVINITGLSIGIACCIILGLFLRSELTYDRHNLKHERIFRLMVDVYFNGKLEYDTINDPITNWEWAPQLAKEYPEIEAYVRFHNMGRIPFRHEEKNLNWDNVYTADEKVFEVFTHNIVYGDPKTALSEPYCMAVSEGFAIKYFGNSNPVGNIITSNNTHYKITLVFADLPENSHTKYDGLISYNRSQSGEAQPYNERLKGMNYHTYLLMSEGYQADSFKNIGKSFYARHFKKEWEKDGFSAALWLKPLADIHLKSDPKIRFYIYGLSAVAIFILLIACFNYMNLATARSMKRGLEVGIRKVLGETRLQLIVQFLGESIFFSLVSLLIGLVLVEVVTRVTPINSLLGKQVLMDLSDKPDLLLWMLGLSLVVGFFSGIYPAIYLSSAIPVSTIAGTTRSGKKGFRVRQILVLVQFIISISVISSAILMALQIRYVAGKSLGFNKDNRLVITVRDTNKSKKVSALKQELLKNSRVLAISETHEMVTGSAFNNFYNAENNDGVIEEQRMSISQMTIGEDFIDVMGIDLVEGKNISHKLWSRAKRHILVNETMVEKMGWKEPVGKRVQLGEVQFAVIGVVKDFHFFSLHKKIGPLIIWTWPDGVKFSRLLIVKVTGDEIPETLKFIQETFEEFDSEHPFEYRFLDDALNDFYKAEQRLMKLIGIFSVVCILISCLGLFGLAAFTTEQRTKEIGVRKVLGASTFRIIAMLSRGILLIVMAASVISSLVTWYAIDEWLTGFAYHAGINPMVFVLSAAIALAVALGTVALQSFKTANENPVKALRYE